MRHLLTDWRAQAAAAAGILLLVTLILYLWRRRPPTPDEIERQRRAHLNQIGRIVEGQVSEIIEAPASQSSGGEGVFRKARTAPPPVRNPRRKLVCYSYSISGVTYETAQDITGLEERLHLERMVAGQPASVKYDPANPSNSILIAEDWSGLH